MANSPIGVIFDMVVLVLKNTIGTLLSIFGLFGDLVGMMFGISGAGGTLGIVLFFGVLGMIGFFVLKLFVGAMKTIGLLIIAGLGLLAFLAIGMGIV
ncbi:MAG: hypothetical protein KAT35_04050 [Candidatus Aenigmarchaeota archaeon]|nr:hypothetical protein [Candidatus Aenigmarchaeota archaeon]